MRCGFTQFQGGTWVLVCLGGSLLALAGQEPGPESQAVDGGVRLPAAARDLVAEFCIGCHAGERPKAGLDLARLLAEPVPANREIWETVLEQLDSGAMPPPKADLPSPSQRSALLGALRGSLVAGALNPPPTLRRLSRVEYANTIRALFGGDLGLDLEQRLPPDARGYGFDNVGDVMFVTPLLIERYLEVTDAVLDAVFAEPSRLPDGLAQVEGRDDLVQPFEHFLLRAFRRPAQEIELAGRVALVRSALDEGRSLQGGLRQALRSVLLSPNFLFRVEQDPEPGVRERALDGFELATRLSYMLWSAPPDELLLTRAALGVLDEPEGLASEAERLLLDRRSKALAHDFAGQWLELRDVRDHAIDRRRFPEVDGIQWRLYEEGVRLFDSVVREDASVLRLLDADYTFLDPRLARHYGIEGVEGKGFRRVTLEDGRRGGLLGLGAVLTVTSYPGRTSPTQRGKWVLEKLLGTSPPPPPPNVGELPEDDRPTEGLTLRQQLERHRRDPSCAACHARFDPYGLALEHYDGVGRWREKIGEQQVDSRATLPDGTELAGLSDVRAALLAHPEAFVRSLTERLFTYAVGRPPGIADEPDLVRVLEAGRGKEYRFSALVQGIVRTRAFRFRGASTDDVADDPDIAPGEER